MRFLRNRTIDREPIYNHAPITKPEIELSNKSVNEIIQQIHDEFDAAENNLLKSAKEILAVSADTTKGERLHKLGFANSKVAVDSLQLISDKNFNKQLAEAIEYFRIYYPNNKFITENMVQSICKKYGIVLAEAEYYQGDVPEKNLSEIESFTLRNEDCNKLHIGWHDNEGRRLNTKTADGYYGYMQNERWGSFIHVEDQTKTIHFDKPAFKICASVKDFDIRNLRLKEGYKLELHIPDPVVLQPVTHETIKGYLVISKWGLEGDDKELVNETNN